MMGIRQLLRAPIHQLYLLYLITFKSLMKKAIQGFIIIFLINSCSSTEQKIVTVKNVDVIIAYNLSGKGDTAHSEMI